MLFGNKKIVKKRSLEPLFAFLCLTLLECTVPDRSTGSIPPDHEILTSVLSEYVNEEGFVDYASLKQDSENLSIYLNLLRSVHPNAEEWSENERLAYWINAYNAFTLQLIIENYPLNSIKDLNPGISIPFINSVWDKKFIEIEGYEYSLNDIEHRILRKKFDEPRIHFAVNCASVSCPPLRNEAYIAGKIDFQLTDQAKKFINNSLYNRLGKEKLKLSKIFSWYKGDFTESGNLIDYLNQYSNNTIQSGKDIKFQDYNWSLNEQNGD